MAKKTFKETPQEAPIETTYTCPKCGKTETVPGKLNPNVLKFCTVDSNGMNA